MCTVGNLAPWRLQEGENNGRGEGERMDPGQLAGALNSLEE